MVFICPLSFSFSRPFEVFTKRRDLLPLSLLFIYANKEVQLIFFYCIKTGYKFDAWASTAWLGQLQQSGTELSSCHLTTEMHSCLCKMTPLHSVATISDCKSQHAKPEGKPRVTKNKKNTVFNMLFSLQALFYILYYVFIGKDQNLLFSHLLSGRHSKGFPKLLSQPKAAFSFFHGAAGTVSLFPRLPHPQPRQHSDTPMTGAR